ncbi:MAG: DUF2149 domain-containing protein [Methanotrichaceae archaeon]
MEITIKNMSGIQVLNLTDKLAGGQGMNVGTAYRLQNDLVVYVPENTTTSIKPGLEKQ